MNNKNLLLKNKCQIYDYSSLKLVYIKMYVRRVWCDGKCRRECDIRR